MTLEQIIGLAIALIIMLIGTLGSILPGIPSTPLVLAGAVAHRLYFGASSVSNLVLFLLVMFALFSLLLDYIASMVGAKRLGATWRGVVGAVVGAIVGLFFSLPGIILGPFLGALTFEMIGGRKLEEAARAGAGAVLGLVAGAVGKVACCVGMTTLFLFSVIRNSWTQPPAEIIASLPPLWLG